MVDNTEIKDGVGNEFTLRTKDVSSDQSGSLRRAMTFATAYPFDYGTGGSYAPVLKSGSMAAGLSAASPVFSFWWSSPLLLAVIRRVKLNAWSIGTGFAAGIATFDLFVARSFTVADTGGATASLTSSNAKLRTSMANSIIGDLRVATTGTLSAGTRTKDTNPISTYSVGVSTSTYTSVGTAPINLFQALQGEHPLVLAQYEGFVIEATVPATGVWGFSVTPEFDEVPLY